MSDSIPEPEARRPERDIYGYVDAAMELGDFVVRSGRSASEEDIETIVQVLGPAAVYDLVRSRTLTPRQLSPPLITDPDNGKETS